MARIKAFIVGMYEFRRTITTRFNDADDAYEWGREWAHRITFRMYDHGQ